jgi:hypothetical protein
MELCQQTRGLHVSMFLFSRSVATAFFVNATQCKLQMLFTSLMFFIGTDATAHREHTSSITGQPFNDPE